MLGLFWASSCCVIHSKLLIISGGNSYLDFDFGLKLRFLLLHGFGTFGVSRKVISLFGTKAWSKTGKIWGFDLRGCTFLDEILKKSGSWMLQNEEKKKEWLIFYFFTFHFLWFCHNSLLQRHLENVVHSGTAIQECSSKSLLLDKPFSQQRAVVVLSLPRGKDDGRDFNLSFQALLMQRTCYNISALTAPSELPGINRALMQ